MSDQKKEVKSEKSPLEGSAEANAEARGVQMELGEKKTLIETITIRPTKEMPKEVFCQMWELAYFMELMDRVDDNHVIWDEAVESIFSKTSADVEFFALQNDLFSTTMEIPMDYYKQFSENLKS